MNEEPTALLRCSLSAGDWRFIAAEAAAPGELCAFRFDEREVDSNVCYTPLPGAVCITADRDDLVYGFPECKSRKQRGNVGSWHPSSVGSNRP